MVNSEIADREGLDGCWKLSHIALEFSAWEKSYKYQVLYRYLLDVLWGQPIKLAHVASTSELLENQQNNLVFFKTIPSHFCRALEASKIHYFKD